MIQQNFENQILLFDKEKLSKFEHAYNEAMLHNQKSFKFEEMDCLVTYAYYLIEYLNIKLNPDKKRDSN